MDDSQHTEQDLLAKRREQLRMAQRRRRERLAQGSKTQVNVFLSKQAIARLDALALLWGISRQDVFERLLQDLELHARAIVRSDSAKAKSEPPQKKR